MIAIKMFLLTTSFNIVFILLLFISYISQHKSHKFLHISWVDLVIRVFSFKNLFCGSTWWLFKLVTSQLAIVNWEIPGQIDDFYEHFNKMINSCEIKTEYIAVVTISNRIDVSDAFSNGSKLHLA